MSKCFLLALLLCSLIATFAMPGSSQILTSVDQRSLKNKIDSSATGPVTISITEDGQLSLESKNVSLAGLRPKLDDLMDSRSPDERVITLVGGESTEFRYLAEIMKLGRELELDDYAFSTTGSDTAKLVRLKIVLDEPVGREPKPGGMFLRVEIAKDGSYSFNGIPQDANSLKGRLKTIFADRTRRKVRVVGGNEIEKSVFIKPTLSTKLSEIMNVVQLLTDAGAAPIGIQIDWLREFGTGHETRVSVKFGDLV
ncbi:MAG: biopolymer transporter ExbD [Acidobacteriota bacterium]